MERASDRVASLMLTAIGSLGYFQVLFSRPSQANQIFVRLNQRFGDVVLHDFLQCELELFATCYNLSCRLTSSKVWSIGFLRFATSIIDAKMGRLLSDDNCVRGEYQECRWHCWPPLSLVDRPLHDRFPLIGTAYEVRIESSKLTQSPLWILSLASLTISSLWARPEQSAGVRNLQLLDCWNIPAHRAIALISSSFTIAFASPPIKPTEMFTDLNVDNSDMSVWKYAWNFCCPFKRRVSLPFIFSGLLVPTNFLHNS